MNILISMVITFIYLGAILYFGIPDINDGKYIQQKAILFIMMFVFQFFLLLFYKLVKRCNIDINRIATNSLRTSTMAIIGYSLYQDMTTMESAKGLIENKHVGKNIVVSAVVVIFIMAMRVIELLFRDDTEECMKNQLIDK